VGAQSVVLTPGRSLAVDPAFVALGMPLWLETEEPLTKAPLRRLVVAQDTGGVIKGPVRGDLFWGSGADAGERAGAMKAQGRYYLLLPKTAAPASALAPAMAAK
jgi:membrane-bound lytic murein transglycosylase A